MRVVLLVVEAYASDVRGEPCAAARDRTGGVLAGRICAARGVGGPREQGADASGLPKWLGRKSAGRSAGGYDLGWEDDTGGKAACEVRHSRVRALADGA